MSRESDKLMLKLPTADVAAWLRQELRETGMASLEAQCCRVALQRLIAKLGADEDTSYEIAHEIVELNRALKEQADG